MSDGGASNNRSKKELTDTVLKYKNISRVSLYIIFTVLRVMSIGMLKGWFLCVLSVITEMFIIEKK